MRMSPLGVVAVVLISYGCGPSATKASELKEPTTSADQLELTLVASAPPSSTALQKRCIGLQAEGVAAIIIQSRASGILVPKSKVPQARKFLEPLIKKSDPKDRVELVE